MVVESVDEDGVVEDGVDEDGVVEECVEDEGVVEEGSESLEVLDGAVTAEVGGVNGAGPTASDETGPIGTGVDSTEVVQPTQIQHSASTANRGLSAIRNRVARTGPA